MYVIVYIFKVGLYLQEYQNKICVYILSTCLFVIGIL